MASQLASGDLVSDRYASALYDLAAEKKLVELPENFIVFATTSQFVNTISEGLQGIKAQSKTKIPSNITTIKHFKANDTNAKILQNPGTESRMRRNPSTKNTPRKCCPSLPRGRTLPAHRPPPPHHLRDRRRPRACRRRPARPRPRAVVPSPPSRVSNLG